MNDTIFALATPPGRGAVAVLRLSGPRSAEAVLAVAGGLPKPRLASLRRLRDPAGETIDQGLVLWFPGPASYTGEDSAEFHLHGGRAVVDALVHALDLQGLRLAEPGEFTRRAFQNGKLDLAQAEAVADLVDAETVAQRRQALDQLGGALGARYAAWRERLLQALALLEAEIDFPDEEGVPQDLARRVAPSIQDLAQELDLALADAERGERVREGFRIAIVGAPNAGKSSLFNALVRREAAIVTPIAGTTRDVLEANFQLGGYKVLLADTAGVRETSEVVEAEGVRRARTWAGDAALRLWVVDASGSDEAWQEAAPLVTGKDLLVLNKADRPKGLDAASALAAGVPAVEVSTSTGHGMAELEAALRSIVEEELSGGDFPAVTRARHHARLGEARDHVRRALVGLETGPELAAEDLRLAGRCLARISGRIDAEDVLDVVFASFCIGK